MALSLNWLREIKKELKAQDTIPLTSTPPFPWDDLANRLAHAFECIFEIHPEELTWLTKDELTADLGPPLSTLTFTISPLKGHVYWIMPKEEISLLESLLLTKESNPFTIQDEAFKESFYQFLALETLYTISQTSFDQSLVPLLTDQKTLPSEDSLCQDISFSIDNRNFWGRLVISPTLRKSLLNYYSQKGPSLSSQELAKNVEVPVHLEIGRTQLTLAEWKEVTLGDFIILDRCYVQSPDLIGQIMMTVQGKSVFKGELSGDHIKILEFPHYQEEDTFMAKHEDEEDDDDLSDLGFEDEDEDLEEFDEFDEDLFEELEDEDQNNLGDEEPAEIPAREKSSVSNAPSEPVDEEANQSAFQMAGKGPLTPDQIPVSLVVELGCIQMTMDKLLQIEPGNLLDITVQPENGVDLTINGRVIAKGELIRIGENLGIRIIELG